MSTTVLTGRERLQKAFRCEVADRAPWVPFVGCHEHKIKYRESLVFMTSLMVRNVPTICIDGAIRFVSRIPPRDQLIAAIQDRINEKFRMKIARRKASLYVLQRAE